MKLSATAKEAVANVRTPIPTWVKRHVDSWTAAAGITHGPIFRAINKAGRVWGDGMSPKVANQLARVVIVAVPLAVDSRAAIAAIQIVVLAGIARS